MPAKKNLNLTSDAPAAVRKPVRARKTAASATEAKPQRAPRKKATAAAGPDLGQLRAEIEREAYYLWLNRGAGHGDAAADWLEAERIVRDRHTVRAKSAAAAA